MTELNFDATQVAPNTSPPPIPTGWYQGMIEATTMKPASNKMGSYLEVITVITTGAYQGRKVYDRLNLNNQNPVAVEIAQGTLSAICHATGVLQVQVAEQLHNIPLEVRVLLVPAEEGYDESNDVKGYRKLDSVAAPGAAPVAAPGAAPGAVPVAAPVAAPVNIPSGMPNIPFDTPVQVPAAAPVNAPVFTDANVVVTQPNQSASFNPPTDSIPVQGSMTEGLTDVQKVAIENIMSVHSKSFDELSAAALQRTDNLPTKLEDLSYQDAVKLIQYGNNLNAG